jgi:retron-type reverse transcriptase
MGELLDRILDFDNVKAAWDVASDKGKTPGVDDWSLRRFGRNWEENLRGLIADVRANRYEPKRLRVRYVPKRGSVGPSGRLGTDRPQQGQDRAQQAGAGRPGMRRLGIPALRDRILQRAALQVLMQRFEGKFLSCSYGYRPKRSLYHAVGAVIRYRDRGHGWLLDADIDNCFDSLDHGVLWPLIEQEVHDPAVLRLLGQWLEVGVVDRKNGKGVSQGMPISPLLCNIYLHELDVRLALRARRALVRYADDFVVLERSREEAERCWELTDGYLAEIKLALKPAKTAIATFDEGFDFLGVHFQGDSYSYTWEEKRIEVSGGMGPLWSLWDYFPHGYA